MLLALALHPGSAPAQPGAPLDAAELRSLTRSLALAQGHGDEGALELGVCVEAQLKGRWLSRPMNELGEQEQALVRAAAEACARPPDELLTRALVAPVRELLQAMVVRLNPYFAPFKTCMDTAVDPPSLGRCAQAVAGRPLEPQELRALWAARRAVTR